MEEEAKPSGLSRTCLPRSTLGTLVPEKRTSPSLYGASDCWPQYEPLLDCGQEKGAHFLVQRLF